MREIHLVNSLFGFGKRLAAAQLNDRQMRAAIRLKGLRPKPI
jgi:hypothetical protein